MSEVEGQERFDARLEIKQVDDATGVFEGHASVFDVVDDDRDQVAPGAFQRSLEAKSVQGIKLLWQHDARKPIGVWEEMREDDKGLFVKGRLLIDGVQQARETHALLKAGAVDGLSIGFSTVESSRDDHQGIRRLEVLDLWEVSLVTFPANEQARVSAVKTVVSYQDLPLGDRARPWDRPRADRRVRAWAGAGDEPNAKYRRAFVWFDRENADSFGAYKLQLADVVDGELKAMPRGIFAVAAVLMGARGGVDIPASDMPKARAHVARYYAKMRSAFDDDTIIAPWKCRDDEISRKVNAATSDLVETERDFEEILRELGFSKKDAVVITASGYKAVNPQGGPAGVLDELVASLRRTANVLALTR